MIFQRVAREYAAQILSFAVMLSDRILVTGLLLRAWGVHDFAAWSIAGSYAGIASIFDFGVNLFFSNKVLFEVQRGNLDDAQRFLHAGNSLMVGAATVGTIVASASLLLSSSSVETVPITPTLVLATLGLIGTTALRMAATVQMSVYRAHGDFFRQTNLTILIDIARILVLIGTVGIGGGYLDVAVAQIVATAIIIIWTLWIDLPRRYPGFAPRFGMLRATERLHSLKTSFGYWLATAPSTILTYLPIFLLTAIGTSAVQVAQFVLLRTIGGFVRTVLQMFSIVLGQEAARRVAIGDADGLTQVFRESARLLTAQTACAAGLLIACARPLFNLWTGKPALFDPLLLWLTLAPVLLVPAMTLAQNFLASANLPWSMALGRALQMALTFALFFASPISDDLLRLITALAAAELIGLGIPVMLATARIIRSVGLVFNLELAVVGAICLAPVAYSASLVQQLLGRWGIFGLAMAMMAGAMLAGIMMFLLGLSRRRRKHLLESAFAHLPLRVSLRSPAKRS